MKQFIVDEYQDGVVMVFAQLATFRVTHTTDIEVEDTYEDCWDYAREAHYTRNTGVNYHATTNIKSIELMLDDEVIAEIKKAIEEAAAIHFALEDEGDSEPDCFEYDEVA